MGSLIFFLFTYALVQQAEMTKTHKQLRTFAATTAANDFCAKRDRSIPRKALIVLPCYNEEKSVEKLNAELLTLQRKHPHIEFCFVNDCSKDSTEMVLQSAAPKNFTSHQINIGVSGVLMTGFLIARKCGYDWVIQCDGDGQHPVEKIPDLISYAEKSSSDLVIGSRFCDSKQDPDQSSTRLRRTGSLMLQYVLLIFGSKATVHDVTSGFRVFSKNTFDLLIQQMPEEYPEPETIALLATNGLKITEFAVTMSERTEGVSSIRGLKSASYMIKSISALIGLRLRTLVSR